jgi:N-methylhydantoinase A
MMENKPENLGLRIGIDIGGTFTDFVIYDASNGITHTYKCPSTPENPSKAVLQGLEQGLGEIGYQANPVEVRIVHGSTIATNALLERKGAKTALITTEGIKDVIQIGRQNRPMLYEFKFRLPAPLIPANLRFEVKERIGAKGNIIEPLDELKLDELISSIKTQSVESVALCFLFSFANPIHEKVCKDFIVKWVNEGSRNSPLFISTSHEVMPEFREYERTSTTAVNAYVSPMMKNYLSQLEEHLPEICKTRSPGSLKFRVMQSNGGSIRIQEAQQYGVRCILSGPAGGVSGAYFIAKNLLEEYEGFVSNSQSLSNNKIITLDMGGTSTDVSLIDGKPTITKETIIAGCPIGIPVLDIHTIGAGGGSIAWVDAGGALRIGPESAGADPGPACYGIGDFPTVTDANLILGRMTEDNFLGGRKKLDKSRSQKVLKELGHQIGLDAFQTALGVIEIVNTHMERALRIISVERGHDPKEYSLISFGGAGGLHAADLARRLNIPRIIIPPMAATLSAFGMLVSDVIQDHSKTVMLPGDSSVVKISDELETLVQAGLPSIIEEGILEKDITIERLLDIRYAGQSYELTLPFSDSIIEDFHRVHRYWYGYDRPDETIEIVNVWIRLIGHLKPPKLTSKQLVSSDPSAAFLENCPIIVGVEGEWQIVPFYKGEKLAAGNQIPGPAIIVWDDTSVYLGPGDQGMVDKYLNTIIKVAIKNDERS